jgi:hypothetical protein
MLVDGCALKGAVELQACCMPGPCSASGGNIVAEKIKCIVWWDSASRMLQHASALLVTQ